MPPFLALLLTSFFAVMILSQGGGEASKAHPLIMLVPVMPSLVIGLFKGSSKHVRC